VRITDGRRRYVLNFNAMIQLNEETSNRRPITLWLKNMNTKEESEFRPETPPTGREYNGGLTSDSESDMNLELERTRILSLLDQTRGVAAASMNNSRIRSRITKKGAKSEKMDVEEEKEMAYVRKRVYMFQGLVRDEVNDLIKYVFLLKLMFFSDSRN